METSFGFEYDASGTAVEAGDFADTKNGDTDPIVWPHGLTITATGTRNHRGEPRRPMLYDTGAPSGNDGAQLGTHQLGLILIVSQNNNQDNPNDSKRGGTFHFSFAEPVKIKDMGFLDLHDGGEVRVIDCSGNTILEADTPVDLNGGHRGRVDINKENICQIDVDIEASGNRDTGSGAVTDITFCSDSPGVWGDPHFSTWSGETFDYHGICDLMFVESPMKNLTIHLRTTQKFSYSYVSSAAIKINDDIMEFGSWGQVIHNGQFGFEDEGVYQLSKSLGGHTLTKKVGTKKEHTYLIEFGTGGGGIEVKSYKDMVAVRLVGTSAHFMDAIGLMGSPIDGSRLGRDGKVVTKGDNAFGQEWQVMVEEPKLFEAQDREPQAPRPCHVPLLPEMTQRRLGEGMARKKAE